MKTRIASLLIAALALALAPTARGQGEAAGGVRGTLVAHSSGSAFAILDPAQKLRRVKLTGIDAPERRQPYAHAARQLASQWLGGAPIDIEVDGQDRDARILGRVSVDGRDLGMILLEAGLAWCDPGDTALLPPAIAAGYTKACDQAREKRLGLWLDPHPIPPWEYRRRPEFDPVPPSRAP